MSIRRNTPGCPCCDEPCIAGPTGAAADWSVISGTWSSHSTSSSNALEIATVGDKTWQRASCTITLQDGDYARFGWSDASGNNRVFVEFTHNVTVGPLAIGCGTYYDQTNNRFYFWFAATSFGVIKSGSTLTYSVYRVTSGGSPALVTGPTTINAALTGGTWVIAGDNYTTLHTAMQRLAFGTGSTSASISFSWNATRNYCDCDGNRPALPRKFTATVTGIATDAIISTQYGTDYYFNVSLLNRSSITLRNYFHYSSAINYTCDTGKNCCHSQYAITGPYLDQIAITKAWSEVSGGNTILWGVALASYRVGPDFVPVAAEVAFRKVLSGIQDVRSLSGQTLDYYALSCSRSGTPPPSPCDFVDATSATMTLTAVV